MYRGCVHNCIWSPPTHRQHILDCHADNKLLWIANIADWNLSWEYLARYNTQTNHERDLRQCVEWYCVSTSMMCAIRTMGIVECKSFKNSRKCEDDAIFLMVWRLKFVARVRVFARCARSDWILFTGDLCLISGRSPRIAPTFAFTGSSRLSKVHSHNRHCFFCVRTLNKRVQPRSETTE